MNDLIRKAREIEYIRAKLIRAEQGGFSNLSAADILAKSKEELRRNGELKTEGRSEELLLHQVEHWDGTEAAGVSSSVPRQWHQPTQIANEPFFWK